MWECRRVDRYVDSKLVCIREVGVWKGMWMCGRIGWVCRRVSGMCGALVGV